MTAFLPFRTVRQSLYYLGGNASNAMRLDGLEKESALRNCNDDNDRKGTQ